MQRPSTLVRSATSLAGGLFAVAVPAAALAQDATPARPPAPAGDELTASFLCQY
jgi:hypothetical protein